MNAENTPQWADLLRQDWQLLFESYWSTIYRYAGAIVVLSALPYIRPEIFAKLQEGLMFLPFAALVLAGIGSWHLVALGKQVTVARQQYLMMLGDFRPTWLQETKRSHRIRDIHLEMAAPRLLFFGTLALSIANVYVILRMTLASLARSTDEYIFGRELIWTFPLAGLLVCTGLLVFGLRAPLDPASERPPVA